MENHQPPAAGKVLLITGETLKKLLQRFVCDPSQFDVKETPESRVYTLRDIPSAANGKSSQGWSGSVSFATENAPPIYLNFGVTNGRIQRVADYLYGGDIPGTEGDPRNGIWYFADT